MDEFKPGDLVLHKRYPDQAFYVEGVSGDMVTLTDSTNPFRRTALKVEGLVLKSIYESPLYQALIED